MIARDRIVRLHCVNALFHALTGHDLYLASQLLEAIEAASADLPVSGCEDLAARLERLHEQLLGYSPQTGFAFCDAWSDKSAGPLFARAELLAALERTAHRPQTTIVVGNLPEQSTRAKKKKHTRSATTRTKEHNDMVWELRELAARNVRPNATVTMFFV